MCSYGKYRSSARASSALIVAFAMLLLGLVGSSEAGAAAGTDRLSSGQSLHTGESLRSPDGRYLLIQQGDGNLVEYVAGRAIWYAAGRSGASTILQGDGNLVLYSADGQTLFNTSTGATSVNELVVQNDGNVVLYGAGGAYWSTGTGRLPNPPPPTGPGTDRLARGQWLHSGESLRSPDGRYLLIQQGDGNLVEYLAGRAIWYAAGRPGASTVLQGDGNLVLYSADGQALFNTSTGGTSVDQLAVQNDGNIVLYGGGKAYWSTSTGRLSDSTAKGANAGASSLNTGGYPYANYNGPGTNAATYTWTDSSGKENSPYGYGYRNCTDFVAWKMKTARGISIINYGNAKSWFSNAKARKVNTTSPPRPGSVAWWDTGKWGHVAWVDSVNGNNVTILEYNHLGNGTYGTQTVAKSSVGGFINF